MDLIRLNCRKTLLNFLECVSDKDNENCLTPQLFIETSISSFLSLITDIVDYNNFGFKRIHPLIISEDIEERIESTICDLEFDSNARVNSVYKLKNVFLCHPSLSSTCTIVKHIEWIHKLLKKNLRKQTIDVCFYIGFVPFYSRAILRLLHQQLTPMNVFPECYSVNLYWAPIDETSLSMEVRNIFFDFHVYKEESSLQQVAYSLYWLLKFTNSINVPIYSIGSAGVVVLEYLIRYIKENNPLSNSLKPFDWNTLFETDDDQSGKRLGFNHIDKDLLTNTLEFTQHYLQDSTNDKDIASDSDLISDFPMAFDKVIIIDRRCDLVTPFSTPFSYHALLDFLFGVQKTYVDIPTDKVPSDTHEESPYWKLPLFGDPLFTTLKDLKLKDVGMYLHQKANELQSLYQEKEKLKDISAIGDFIRKLKGKQHEQGTLAKHVNIATFLNEYFTKDHQTLSRLRLEDSIMSDSPQSVTYVVKELSTRFSGVISLRMEESPLEDLLDQEDIQIEEIYRILCLSCIVENGFKNKKVYERLKKHILSVFGFEELYRMNILERVGLFKLDPSRKSNWQLIKRSLNLFVDESESENDISCVYSGYAPISTRLVEMLCREVSQDKPGSNDSLKEALNYVWGPSVELAPTIKSNIKHNSCLVVFVGGVTFGEITTLRKLQGIINKEITVATTEIINHRSFFESCKKPESMSHLKNENNYK